ncbi:MAG: septal ring lytic transglycosylase RlpA family protein, partial [Solirubrobacteraceae bacterium]
MLVFAGALAIPLGLGGTSPQPSPRVLAASIIDDTPPADRFLPPAPPAPTPEPTPPPQPVTVRATQAPAIEGAVIASWYGPGFYGNRTACGQLYTPEIVGVAHRTLPCGTLI